MPLNCTKVAPVKFVPVKIMESLAAPLVGVKLVMVGAGVKLLVLVAVPPGVVTEMGPVVAPVGTVKVIWEIAFTVKLLAMVPLNLTAETPVKLVPVRITAVPTAPLLGLKLVIVGATTVTVKLVLLVAVPPGVVTEMGPVVAPLGTRAVS